MAETRNKDGGAAFASQFTEYSLSGKVTGFHNQYGMTLRDWFAGQALAGLARDISDDVTVHRRDRIVLSAYEIADAMVEARSK